MYIKFRNNTHVENNEAKANLRSMRQVSFVQPELLLSDDKYRERPLKSNSANLSFEGLKVSDAIKTFGEEIGESAAKHLEETIKRLVSTKNSGVTLENGELIFKKDSKAERFYRAIGDPLVHFPQDIANSALGFLKKVPGFKNSKSIDNLLENKFLKDRRIVQENFSNAMALQQYFEEMLTSKDLKGGAILKEAQTRLKAGLSSYNTKNERSLTRIVTGIIPAFFLANDAYNLSIYVNNNKDLAKQEKKRRFYQEVTRVAITAAATFACLGFFAKKSNQNPAAAAGLIAALTFASELVGRMISGTPFYPVGKKGAIRYAKLQNKDKKDDNADKTEDKKAQIDPLKNNSQNKKSKSDYALKLLAALALIGFGIDNYKSITPIRKIVDKTINKYKEFFVKDFTISQKEFKELVLKLRENGFDKLADNYEKTVKKIIEAGNLTAKESSLVDIKVAERVESLLPQDLIITPKKLDDAKKLAKEQVKRKDIIKEMNFAPRSNEIINICGDSTKPFKDFMVINKTKDIIFNQILGAPVRFGWEILMMPYKWIVKPLYELPKQGIEKIVTLSKYDFNFKKMKEAAKSKSKNAKGEPEAKLLKNGIEYLRKNINDPDLKNKINSSLIDSFDKVNKSNISSAELGGSAKTAVSATTSAFLILDNYNMVMIDTEGEDKKLAGQKAKERTIQRIIRIAYGAGLIKLFNGVFKSQYDASLVGAEAVTTACTFVTETLERTSVGLPLHEATREEIIEKDNETLNAKGLKGAYFRIMAKLTGKKPLSEKVTNKKD